MVTRNTHPFALAVTLTVLLSLCSGPAQSQEKEPLKLGVHPYLASSELIKRFSPLADYLGKRLGRPVTIDISSTYDTHIQKLANGFLDVAFMGPASYVKLTGQSGRRPILAAFETTSGKTFRGYIIARSDSPLASLAQLKGKRFAFGDPDSTLSHVVPRHMLLKSGIDIKQFTEVKYLANHDNIALGVLSGAYDAGAVKQETFHQYQSQGLKSLAVSPPIPDHLFVARTGLPQSTVQALTKALLALKDSAEGRLILSGIRKVLVALVPGDDRDYDILRTIENDLKKAGLDL